MHIPDRLFAALRGRRPAYGTWAQMNSPEFCEIAASAGLDFVIVDMEHGSFGIESAVHMTRAAQLGGATALVRTPDASRTAIFKALDTGANGVLVPNVDSAEMAAAIVAASRYAPDGQRGACPCTRATAHGVTPWPRHVEQARDHTFVAALIETPQGIANFERILDVPGLDAVALGPFDLSQALGLNGDWKHPDVQAAQSRMVRQARAKGMQVMMSIFDSDPRLLCEQIARWQDEGAALFVVSGDRFLLSSSFNALNAILPRPGLAS
ncbi:MULTISPECIES: HpcH/HpaI aldolase family protein [Bordetella]|uniref:Aldolase n=1 Tax=Bordetella genomosp. 6 TaxID=463024 RepID=A0ABX4FFQ7_9BORD|nr:MULTISPECIES: aldolase/citrate lyase family protein [Bordetella]AOB28109.1 aldolase [Bordetella bronchiseptica]ARP75558.1 aldolase [Bordetella genomosp. 6]AZW45446.1 aldolase [Bordetella bronchiseptica]KCV66479.1 HpcH/HpaI aldolase/citrate lyase family protein [Bordetella bronchiseptica 99-R-0433]MBN3266369.1 aldolase [Bordetella bronchiseptica]